MTEIAFHFNVPDSKLAYVCRFLRKTTHAGVRVVVLASGEMLDTLDESLWTFSTHDFVPHCKLGGAHENPVLLQSSSVVLLDDIAAAPHQQVLLNLHAEPVEALGQFERLIEVVSRDDEADIHAARKRWRYYRDRGYTLIQHDLARIQSQV